MLKVCFVCLGNICRSPTAEGVFKALVADQRLEKLIEVDSAGTAAYHAGERADTRSAAAAKKRGYRLTSIARQFNAEDFDNFDYVLAMDRENLRALRTLVPRGYAGHLSLLLDFHPELTAPADVPDPYYGGSGGFEEVLDLCEVACRELLVQVASRLHSQAPELSAVPGSPKTSNNAKG